MKSDRFPIAGTATRVRDPIALDRRELPLLIHPRRENPEQFLGWEGLDARVVAKTKKDRKRAAVTLDFFALTHRDDVRQARARQLVDFARALASKESEAHLERDFTGDGAVCAAAMRAFRKVWETRPADAKRMVVEANQYLDSFR